MISSLRKENGMTQSELAEKMGVTDKAVSKWERDLSYPDVNSIPKLAEVFGVSVDELMQSRTESQHEEKKDITPLINGINLDLIKGQMRCIWPLTVLRERTGSLIYGGFCSQVVYLVMS